MMYTNACTLTKTDNANHTSIKTKDRGYAPTRTDDHDASRGVIHGVLIGGMIWAVILAFLFL